MRKIFFIASILFLCGFSCVAQTINQNEFEKIVDYVNCRYAKAYIENTNASQSDKEAYNNKIKAHLENNSFDSHLSYTDLYNLLKNNSWGQTANNLIKVRKESKKFADISSKTNLEIIDYIIEISGNFKTDIGDKTIKEVETELKERYANKPQETPKVVEKAIEPTPLQTVQVATENKNEYHWVIWLIIALEGILLCVFSYFLYRLWKRCNKLKRMLIERENSNKSSSVEMFEAKLQQLEREFGELQEKVRNIKLEPISPNTIKTEDKIIETPVNVQEPKISYIKYFRTKQGKVLQEEVSNQSDASFKIYDINNNEAKFEYCGGVVNPDFFTEICTFENNPADVPHKKEIRTTAYGTVKKDNNNWVIDKPAKIKFI
ncbi:MAG: hypothetical protein ACOX0V_01145 [Bacteroidales bacterium]|jgi:hypothetical protein